MGFDVDGDEEAFHEEQHEINVTPFIDVMLVLLIVFMVAAPLATVQVPVDLPASSAAPVVAEQEPVFLTLRADLGLSLGEQPVLPAQLGKALGAATGGDRDTRVFLRADTAVPYGEVMSVLDRLREAGWLKVALVGRESSS